MKFFYISIMCCILLYLGYTGTVFAEEYDSYILKYKDENNVQVITAEEKDALYNYVNISGKKLKNQKEIEYLEPNYEVYLYNNVLDKNWNKNMVNAASLNEYGCYGNDIKIAVLDSGAAKDFGLHQSLMPGFNVIQYTEDTTDRIGHGTFVCGIIANETGNVYAEGIAQKAKIIPVKCFDQGYTTKVDKIAEAIDYAVNVCDCDIINMSFGLNGNSTYLKSKIDSALQKGVIVVAAVGNNGTAALRYPASYEGVIGVGAVDEQCSWCDFSQYNSSVDVVAPGKNISGISIDGYMENSGTSFSAPHVTAAAAIAKCIDDTLTPSKFDELLQATSNDLGERGYDEYYGYGLLNIENLINEMLRQYNVFMSPISIENNTADITVINTSSNDISALTIFSDYNKTRLINAMPQPIFLRPGEKLNLSYEYLGTDLKYFLWDGLKTLKPLIEPRYINIVGN